MAGNWTAENPPYGAVFTYNVAADLPADSKLVLTINDAAGNRVRQLDLEKTAGLRRIAWNLRGDPPATAAAGRGGEPIDTGAAHRGTDVRRKPCTIGGVA